MFKDKKNKTVTALTNVAIFADTYKSNIHLAIFAMSS